MILIAGFIGTTIMTIFSYIYSHIRSRQFREPELLNILINNCILLPSGISKRNISGWILHYFFGWIIVLCFEATWQFTSLPISYISGIILGFGAGIISVFAWIAMFFLNPDPPHIRLKEYYVHLVLAHIVFGVTVVAYYIYYS